MHPISSLVEFPSRMWALINIKSSHVEDWLLRQPYCLSSWNRAFVSPCLFVSWFIIFTKTRTIPQRSWNRIPILCIARNTFFPRTSIMHEGLSCCCFQPPSISSWTSTSLFNTITRKSSLKVGWLLVVEVSQLSNRLPRRSKISTAPLIKRNLRTSFELNLQKLSNYNRKLFSS